MPKEGQQITERRVGAQGYQSDFQNGSHDNEATNGCGRSVFLRGGRSGRFSGTSSMKGAWDKLIQCSIDYDDTMVFHKISGIMWTAEEVADKALFASEDFLGSLQRVGGGTGDTGDNVLEMDVGVGTGEYNDEVPGEDVLAGDVENQIDADFDSGASQRLVMGIFKEESHNKIQEIGALVPGYKGDNLTFDELGKLGRLTTSLVGLWSRMEAAWDEAMVNIESGSIFEELEEIVATVEEAISSTVRSSELFVRQNGARSPCTEDSPADGTLVVPMVVDGAEESHEVGDADMEETRVNVETIPTSPRGHVAGQLGPVQLVTDASRKGIGYCLVQIVEGHQLIIKAGSRPLNPEEGNYTMVQLEILAVWWATDECHAYLVDTIITGSWPLLRILSQEGIQGRGRNAQKYKCKVGWVLRTVRMTVDTVTGLPSKNQGTQTPFGPVQ